MQTTHRDHVSMAHASFCTLILLSASWLCALHTFVSFLFLKYAELNFSAWTTLLSDSQTAPDSHLKSVQIQDPIDGSPPGSAIPGILQARTLERVAISFSDA